MIGFAFNMGAFAFNILIGMVWGFTHITIIALTISLTAAMIFLALDS